MPALPYWPVAPLTVSSVRPDQNTWASAGMSNTTVEGFMVPIGGWGTGVSSTPTMSTYPASSPHERVGSPTVTSTGAASVAEGACSSAPGATSNTVPTGVTSSTGVTSLASPSAADASGTSADEASVPSVLMPPTPARG